MSLRASFSRKVFRFNFKARTSRGLMKDKTSWFIRLGDENAPEIFGIGECGPLQGLSIDHRPDFEDILAGIIDRINASSFTISDDDAVKDLIPSVFPSILFGVETALLDLQNGGKRILYNNAFLKGTPVPINGLIWMGDIDFMMDQINKKVAEGFNCLKLKVGGLDFDRECDILSYIRRRYFRQDIMIRLDANGAFRVDDVLYKLGELAKFQIHSIEQPIKPGLEEMEELCRKSPIPVAFDEELIGITSEDKMERLLERLKPQYLVLKPTLHGGFKTCEQWIRIANASNIGWWMTSALESSVGLNAVCQFAANYQSRQPQGLGTGTIYENNINSPLMVKSGHIFYDQALKWDEESLRS